MKIKTNYLNLIALTVICPLLIMFSQLPTMADTKTGTETEMIIGTTIPPLGWLISQIAGGEAQIIIMVESGFDPHSFDPKPSQLIDLASADIYFSSTLECEENFLPRLSRLNKNLKLVDLNWNIELLEAGESCNHPDHNHKHDHHQSEHDHHQHLRDSHTWLAPSLFKIQAETIYNTLKEIYPENSELFENNYSNLIKLIDQLNQEIKALFPPELTSRNFMVFHPSWSYFARDYKLTQIPLELDGKEPGPRDLAAVIEQSRKAGNIKVIFTDPASGSRIPQMIASALNAEIFEIDPLEYHWDVNLKKVAEAISASLAN